MKRRVVSLAAVALTASLTVHASGYLTALDNGVLVSQYLMHEGGGMTVWISGISNPDNCGVTDKVHLKGDLPGHSRMVAAVIAAAAAGKKVGFWSRGCSTIPFWGGTATFPIVNDLWVIER